MNAFFCQRHNVHPTTLPCPDGKQGCLVVHFGCPGCAGERVPKPSQFSDTRVTEKEWGEIEDGGPGAVHAVCTVLARIRSSTRSPVQGETESPPDPLSPVHDAIHAGKVHLHHKGGTYRPLLIAKNSDDHVQERVIYMSLTHGSVWDRTLAEWAEEIVWPDGVRRRRFIDQDLVSLAARTYLDVWWAEEARKAAETAKIEAERLEQARKTGTHPGELAEGASWPISASASPRTMAEARDAIAKAREAVRLKGTIFDDPYEESEESVVSPPSDALIAEAGFWKRMLIRAICGCLARDCGKHGAYNPANVDRVYALEEIAAIQARRDGKER